MQTYALIGLDWGSSMLRAWAFDAEGSVIRQTRSARGVLRVTDGAYRSVLMDEVGSWLADSPGVPMLAAGMIGARGAWHEVPYLATPARLDAVVAGLYEVPDGPLGHRLYIVPGLKTQSDWQWPDVLRGEETQVFGALALSPALRTGSCVFVLPGTHSKWLCAQDEGIRAFRSCMTGELYDLLLRHSVVGRISRDAGETALANPEEEDLSSMAFDEGVRRALADPASALARLFTVRAEGVLGTLPAQRLAHYLSGLLIGAEVAAGISWLGREMAPVLIAADTLGLRYQRAMTLAGLPYQSMSGDVAAAGLFTLACRAGLVQHSLSVDPGDPVDPS